MSVFLVIICFVTISISESSVNCALHIIDGRDAEPGEYPFVVRIVEHGKAFYENNTVVDLPLKEYCTGTALSAKWTLTARHCVMSNANETVLEIKYYIKFRHMIRYGSLQGEISANGSLSAIIKYEYLPITRPDSIIFDDVALCNTEPILIEKYAKLSAVHYTALYGHEVSVAGFGLMRQSATTLNNTLNLGKPLQVWEKGMLRSCEKWKSKYIHDVCAFPSLRIVATCERQTQNTHKGDSGGPIFHASGIIGVVSRGIHYFPSKKWQQRNNFKGFDVITPISPYINWIADVLRNS